MNSDYIISGKGQSTLMGASWAARGGGMMTGSHAATDAAMDDEGDLPETSNGKSSNLKAADDRSHLYAEKSHTRGPEAMTNSDMTFEDFIDIVNPLQHIPLVNMAYRAITGDKISGVAQIAGSALYGGPLGIVSGVANAMVQEETGKDIGGTVVAMLTGEERNAVSPADAPDGATGDNTIMLAENDAGEEALTDDQADQLLLASAQTQTAPAVPLAAVESRALPPATQMAAAKPAEKAGEKKPFGGIYDNAVANAAKGAPNVSDANASAELAAAAAPLSGLNANGQKFYSLADVPRAAARETHMPIGNMPDVRLKPLSRQAVGRKPAAATPVESADAGDAVSPTTLPLVSKEQANKILGLDQSAHPPVAQGSASSATPSLPNGRNPLPPELIQDLMMKGIQKYQDGLSSGSFARPSVDVEG